MVTRRSDRHQGPLGPSHNHQDAQCAKQPHGRLASSGGPLVFAQRFAHARRAIGFCARPSPAKVSRPLHAAYSRTGPREALAARRCSSLGNSLRTAQIAHRKYAVQHARLVPIRARTDNRFAPRFAPSYARLVRTRPAVTMLVIKEGYQSEWFPVVGFHCGFQGFAVASTGNLARPRTNHGSGSPGPR